MCANVSSKCVIQEGELSSGHDGDTPLVCTVCTCLSACEQVKQGSICFLVLICC